MKSAEIRQKFLDYFQSNNHAIIQSSSLIPGNDPTLLFVNSGMVQFKDVFLGTDKRNYSRATTAQSCLRAGGKHNDLDNVGYTARHHTFFEMLGNFSFGDYFKEEAITMAWMFITQTLGIPKEKLTVTVHYSDQEAEDIWITKVGIPKERVIRCGDKDNFWSMGDTGPCGPCTEIFYDHGEDVAGGPPGSADADGDRFIEIWNLVFMQFNRTSDGQMHPLPKPSVDTGMGLERLSAVMQGVHNNYETDLFTGIISSAARLANLRFNQGDLGGSASQQCRLTESTSLLTSDSDAPHALCAEITPAQLSSLRVIADHIRSASFLIKDSIVPSNEGRGYVLRRIIRRALRHGHKLNMPKHFFSSLVSCLVDTMGDAYPDLRKAEHNIEAVLRREEDAFAVTLDQGMRLLEKALISTRKEGDQPATPTITGDVIFKLYDTYGFPVDLTADVARERGFDMDHVGFEKCMEEQKKLSRNAGKFDIDYNAKEKLLEALTGKKSEFLREATETAGLIILCLPSQAILSDVGAGVARPLEDCNTAQSILVLDKTPFYPEGGGQVGDIGEIIGDNFIFRVDTTVREGDAILHYGKIMQGDISDGDEVVARIDISARKATMRHHSATHLLHEALKKILGSHVQQKGSLVAPHRLRFDFSHFEPITQGQLRSIEELVNTEIINNNDVHVKEMAIELAKEAGAMALFGEKYGDVVRTIKMGTSFELCGGTHVARTGDIGAFKIISEGSIASGIRRIEAVAGPLAWQVIYHEQDEAEQQKNFAAIKHKELEKTIDQLKVKLATEQAVGFLSRVKKVDAVNLLVAHVGEVEAKILATMVESLKSKLTHAVIVLASKNNDSACVVVGVSVELHNKMKAGDLVKYLAPTIDGKGGGRPDIAQAGGKLPEKIADMLAMVEPFVKERA